MLQTWEMLVFVGYGIPCVSLYIFVLYHILFKPGFQSAFFKLSAVMGILDLINHLTIWLDLKLILYPLTGWIYPKIGPNYFFTLLHFFKFYNSKVRELLILSTAINRFTALCFPMKQQRIWDTCLWPIIGFCTISPIFSTFQILTGVCKILPFYLSETNSIYVIDVTVNWFHISNAEINAIHTCIASILSFIFNVMTLINLFLRSKKLQNGGSLSAANHKAEKNLLIIGILDFMLDLVSAFHQFLAYYFVIRNWHYDPIFDQIYLLYPWSYDIVNLSRPFLIVIICEQMRKAFISLWISKKKNEGSTYGGTSLNTAAFTTITIL